MKRNPIWLFFGFLVLTLSCQPQSETKEDNRPDIVIILATCLELSNTAYPERYQGNHLKPLRGKGLVPLFKGERMEQNRELYWEHFGHQAMRQGKWKIISKAPEFDWELFDLDEDPTELNEIGEQNPQILEEKVKDYAYWAEEVGVRY